MSHATENANFDVKPPMPVDEYAATVAAVNVGYDLVFTLTFCFLRALGQPTLELLVIGAGGGRELKQLVPENPGWRVVGVDPSQDMLALARREVERVGVEDRVELVQGTVDQLPATQRFDAALCLYVLHFLPDDAKLALLRAAHQRLRPGAPLLVASAARLENQDLREDFLGAWQHHGEMMGLPGDRMSAIIQQLVGRQEASPTEDDYVRLLHKAGFQRVAPFLSIMDGAMVAWIAR